MPLELHDQLMILAEGGEHAAAHGGVSPALVALGTFIILLALLGITFLSSGLNQPSVRSRKKIVRPEHRD